MSLEPAQESPREQLLAEVYAQPDPGAADRTRAVERFMQTRAAALRPRRRSARVAWPTAAAVAVCALSAALAWTRFREPEPQPPAPAPVEVQASAAPALSEAPAPAVTAAEHVVPPSAAEPAPREVETVAVTARRPEPVRVPTPVRVPAFAEPDRSGDTQAADLAPEAASPVASMPDPKALVPPPALLASPITLGVPPADRMRELEGQRGNDMAEVLPALGSATVDPCAKPERVGAAVPAQGADDETGSAACPGVIER